jgi:hypothetical protein
MLRVYSVERTLRRLFTYEYNLLRITHGGEKSPDRISGKFTGEEEPVDCAVQRELSRRPRENEQNEIRVAPD